MYFHRYFKNNCLNLKSLLHFLIFPLATLIRFCFVFFSSFSLFFFLFFFPVADAEFAKETECCECQSGSAERETIIMNYGRLLSRLRDQWVVY